MSSTNFFVLVGRAAIAWRCRPFFEQMNAVLIWLGSSYRLLRQVWPVVFVLCVLGCKPASSPKPASNPSDEFFSLMNAGKNYLDQGDATNALAIYRKAEAIAPHDVDLRMNLANSYLAGGAAEQAIREADEVLKLDPNSAAAYFVKGSAYLRMGQPDEAVKAFENARRIEPGQTATLFQLGVARSGMKQWEEAIGAFKEGLASDPNHLHATAHYLLAQALIRGGRQAEGQQELEQYQVGAPEAGLGMAAFERCKYTQARVPFKLFQPEQRGVDVKFVDATKEVLGDMAANCSGFIGVIDPNRTGWSSLFVLQPGQGFRLLWNTNGIFRADATVYQAIPGCTYQKALIGDLQNDRFEDIIVLGDKGSSVFRFGTNGSATDVSQMSGLSTLSAKDGLLMDLDFTGKLDLVTIGYATNDVRLFRQFGPFAFRDITSTSGIPNTVLSASHAVMEDWNRDEVMDLIVSRRQGSPLLLEKQRGGVLLPRELTNCPSGTVFCTGDFDNDFRPDLAIVANGKINICFNGGVRKEFPVPGSAGIRQLIAVDYDNDGWLDLWAVGDRIQVWRNRGVAGFEEQTTRLGLDKLEFGPVAEIRFADFDLDCDSDAILVLANGGLRYLRNDGANANMQIKVQLTGNRSNSSGLGCKVEVETAGLRLMRTVESLPVEIGVGKSQKLDSFLVHWFNWPQGSAEVPLDCKEPLLALELTIQEGSCPYLYAWDGKTFRFVTDILGAAPLGLPVAEGRYIEAQPEEFVWIGNENTFRPRAGNYELQITEELREVLYLDEAKLVVVDHEDGTEVHPTNKLLPGKPFPQPELLTLHNEHALRRAETLDGEEVTDRLTRVDGRRVSPARLRAPQLRGLAEAHGLVLDFGPLNTHAPLVLVMNGWLRFGGGMANIAASHDPSIPFPFPRIEAEVAPGQWKPVEVTVGAPAGKTKTVLVDLEGKLEPGTRRLRLTEGFEIHWDRIVLLEKKPDAKTRIVSLSPKKADLHFRGFSALERLPADWPPTPNYEAVSPNSYWTITPGGWCTRYGDVAELVVSRDEGLALINGGDELTLKFSESSLPPKSAEGLRDFFLYADGWDKDSDFHVAAGTQVGPLPFHGMRDELYGQEERPQFPSDALHERFNTRWVEGKVLKQIATRSQPREESAR
jgi:hypothetical protein